MYDKIFLWITSSPLAATSTVVHHRNAGNLRYKEEKPFVIIGLHLVLIKRRLHLNTKYGFFSFGIRMESYDYGKGLSRNTRNIVE